MTEVFVSMVNKKTFLIWIWAKRLVCKDMMETYGDSIKQMTDHGYAKRVPKNELLIKEGPMFVFKTVPTQCVFAISPVSIRNYRRRYVASVYL